MTAINYEYGLLSGLNDFWSRYFADAPQLESLYRGSSYLLGQSYLDLLENVLGLSIADAPLFSKIYHKLLTIRENEITFVKGDGGTVVDRYVMPAPDNIVGLITLDNKVIDPDATLQSPMDFELLNGSIQFFADPTQHDYSDGHGPVPLHGYAKRALDVASGGSFTDSTIPDWIAAGIQKGDTLRLLRIGPGGQEARIGDFPIAVVRPDALHITPATPFTTAHTAAAHNYVINRRRVGDDVVNAALTFVGNTATVYHRLINGTVKVYGKSAAETGVVEGVDYTVDYERGKIIKLRPWSLVNTAATISYSWLFPIVTSLSTPVGVAALTATVRVVEMAMWAPDALVDRMRLSNNFGTMIGKTAPSSEAYRSFLKGIFQLYILGPVLERFESALNVVLGLPVVKDDGEVLVDVSAYPESFTTTGLDFTAGTITLGHAPIGTRHRELQTVKVHAAILGIDVKETVDYNINYATGVITRLTVWDNLTPITVDFAQLNISAIDDPNFNRVTTQRLDGSLGTYDYPVATPLRSDLNSVSFGTLTFQSFEPLTTAVTVTDYVQDPTWWHTVVIPEALFQTTATATVPAAPRRAVSPLYVESVSNPIDGACSGDPGLFSGADDEGHLVAADHPIYRHRMAFVLMDRLLKFHTFTVKFASDIFVDSGVGVKFAQDPSELQRLILDARPKHTYAFMESDTTLKDTIVTVDLGLLVQPTFFLLDSVLFTDDFISSIASPIWTSGDYFHYEYVTEAADNFGGPVTLGSVPAGPRHRRIVRVVIAATIGGKPVVEGTDYSIDYATGVVTPLTGWDSLNPIQVKFLQLNIGNVGDAPADPTIGDVYIAAACVDPSLIVHATEGSNTSCVERALTLTTV